jgi:hypothetical protein
MHSMRSIGDRPRSSGRSETSWLNWLFSVLTSILGIVYMAYGKRQVKFVPLLCGLALCVYTTSSTAGLARGRGSALAARRSSSTAESVERPFVPCGAVLRVMLGDRGGTGDEQ